MLYQRLGGLLAEAGRIPWQDLARIREAAPPDTPELALLLSAGVTTPGEVCDFLRQQFGIGYWEPGTTVLSPHLRELVPLTLARKHRMVPVRADGDALELAMADPLDIAAADAAALAARKRVLPLLAAPEAIDRAIAEVYATLQAEQALQELRTGEAPAQTPPEPAPEDAAPMIRLVGGFLEYAVSRNASDIHLEPREDGMAVRMRIDGRLRQCFRIPVENQAAVIARVKVMGEMDIAEHRLPQDGRSHVRVGQTEVDLRISTMPTVWGEKAVIRLLHKAPGLLSPEGIGLAGIQLEKYRRLLELRSGMLLLAGPTGAGKSATMYTMIQALNSEEVNLVTLEDPVEYNIHRVNQIPIQEKAGMRFAAALRSVLRQDPDIIAVGEIRDPETADIAIGAAITGHLVLSTIHCADAPGAIDRLRDMGVENYRIASALRGVIAQRLVRKICPGCRESYPAPPEEQLTLGLPLREDRVFFRGRGCPRCFGSGYLGRTAVFEVLTLSPQLRRAVSQSAAPEEIRALLKQEAHSPLSEDCVRLVVSGITTVSEALDAIRSADS